MARFWQGFVKVLTRICKEFFEGKFVNKGTPYQSCLEPFEDEIIGMRRRKKPISCAKIAKHLQMKHQISVTRQAIYEFLKIRAKGYKSCKYAWSIESAKAENQPTTEAPSVSVKPRTTVSEAPEKTQKQAVTEVSKTATPATSDDDWESKPFEMEFSETYNLTRLPPEEAARRNKIIEEKMRARYNNQ